MADLEWGMSIFVQSGPPWWGNSLWRDRASVARYGRWDADKRQYKAPNEHALLKLLETGLWCPTAVAQHQQQFVEYLHGRKQQRDALEAEARAQEQARAKAQAIARLRRRHEEERERELQQARDDKIKALSKNHHVRRELGVVEDQPEVVHQLLEEYGVTADQIAASGNLAELGPRSGMSDAERVRRAFQLGGGIRPHAELCRLLANAAAVPPAHSHATRTSRSPFGDRQLAPTTCSHGQFPPGGQRIS